MLLPRLIWAVVHALFTKRTDLVAENLALRQQLIVLHRKTKRPRLRMKDRIFWLWLAQSWDGWRESLLVVKPATVVRWHRQGFKYYWTWREPDCVTASAGSGGVGGGCTRLSDCLTTIASDTSCHRRKSPWLDRSHNP